MTGLSVIIPFVNEYPQVFFTIRNIAEELRNKINFEILAIDNWCKEVENQGFSRQKDGEMIRSMSEYHKWLRYLTYSDKLSHWNSKRIGVENASYDMLFFIDAHCLVSKDSLFKAVDLYSSSSKALDGTLHFPLTYHILEKHKLIYKLVWDSEINNLHYSFTSYKDSNVPYEVPVMSSCGMFMTKDLYNLIGGLPKELGIYGGGENYINFALSIMGKKKWIFPGGVVYHHGAKRKYSFNWDDYTKNRIIANYCVGGEEWTVKWLNSLKGSRSILFSLYDEVVQKCKKRRERFKKKQVIDINSWIDAQIKSTKDMNEIREI